MHNDSVADYKWEKDFLSHDCCFVHVAKHIVMNDCAHSMCNCLIRLIINDPVGG